LIYFVQRKDRAIKIGTSIRLSQRLKTLRSVYGRCEVLAVVDGSYADEAALHGRFLGLRVEGEWFSEDQRLLDFIAEEGRPWDGKDEAPPITRVMIADDLHRMARVIAALRDQPLEDVIAEAVRPDLTGLYRREIATAVEK
jgi:hypothetical protein